MNKKKYWLALYSFAVIFLGFGVGTTQAAQTLLPGNLIPKFVDPLPIAGDITVVNAQDPAIAAGYNIHLREFQAQILPSTGVPLAVPPIPANTPSWVWGYLTDADVDAGGVRTSYLGPVVIAQRGLPAYPTYLNELPSYWEGHVQQNLPIDMTLDWANPQNMDCLIDPTTGIYNEPMCGLVDLNLDGILDFPYTGPLPDSVHIHGGEVAPAFDGGPDAWFTQDNLITGKGYPGTNRFEYPNGQQEATIWFHPHGFGITRLNVFAGMAGVYEIVDPVQANAPQATMPPGPAYDIPLIIQDRSFDTAGEIFYNLASNPQPNPTVHPFWIPEFIGDTIVVNGKTWPYLNVEPRQYRLRLLNGSNARFYDLSMNKGVKFTVIATDDGYLPTAAGTPNVIIAPGERYEVIVDFSKVKPGQNVTMFNAARTPFPGGALPTKNGTDTIMQFRVNLALNGTDVPTIANGTAIRSTPLEPIINGFTAPPLPLGDPAVTGENIVRQLTLNEVIGAGGPLELVLNNSKYNLDRTPDGSISPDGVIVRETELPAVGDTEVWEIINITADAHPMHTHLVSFQLLDRTPFQSAPWITQYDTLLLANLVPPGGGPPNTYNIRNADGAIGGNPPINAFLQPSKLRLPLPYEKGWKDTVIAYPGEVTRIVVRWAPQDAPATGAGAPTAGDNLYMPLFDPTELIGGVGYVWHCHILDHEDNEMMRTYTVMPTRQPIQ